MLLASVGWKRGCQPFSYPCWQNVMHCRKEICWICLSSKESHSRHSVWDFQASTLYQKSLRSPESRQHRSTRSAIFCLLHAHPFVAASRKKTCLMQRSGGFGHGVVCSKICYVQYCDCALSCAMRPCCKQCFWRELLATVELQVGLPAFRLRMFAKCNALQKGDFVGHVMSRESIPTVPFLEFETSNP